MIKPNQIPSTGRSVRFQLKQLGFTSLVAFAASLPPNARVADVGAGLSVLGHNVSRLRPDVHWLNIDPCYNDPGIRRQALKNLPKNVELLTEDIVLNSALLAKMKGTFDLVYSYWLLPHLSLENDNIARHACTNMYQLLKPAGKLIVGPRRQFGLGFFSPFRYHGVIIHTKAKSQGAAIEDIVFQTKLWWLPRAIQLLANRHNIHIASKLVGGKTKK